MFNFCQSDYKKIIKDLSKAKNSHNLEDIKNALIKLSNTLDLLLEKSKKTPLIFSDFVYDSKMLFRAHENKYFSNKSDIEIQTNGLLAQLLQIIDVQNFQSISDNLSFAIDSLHSQLSCGNSDVTKEREFFKKAIDIFNLSISRD